MPPYIIQFKQTLRLLSFSV